MLQSAPTQLRGILRFALRKGLEQAVAGAGPDDTAHGRKLLTPGAPHALGTVGPASRASNPPSSSGVQMRSVEARPSLLLHSRAACPKGPTPNAERRAPLRSSTSENSPQLVGPSRLSRLPATLAELRDPSDPKHHLCHPFRRCSTMANLHAARRGPQASRMSTFAYPDDSTLFHQTALRFANADVPVPVLAAALGGFSPPRRPCLGPALRRSAPGGMHALPGPTSSA